MNITENRVDNMLILTCESAHLRFQVAPALGGRIVSIYNKALDREFVYQGRGGPLRVCASGEDYDASFQGGIDELIPNDISEEVDGIAYPDHGELWTAQLKHTVANGKVTVSGKLPLSDLYYERTMFADPQAPLIHFQYRIRNESSSQRRFLWKLHAALSIQAGDRLTTDAQLAKVVYADATRFKDLSEFRWPKIDGCDASVVPSFGNTMDFFYLYNISRPAMEMVVDNGANIFIYGYDKKVFPYQWYFASYGKFLNHYTAILEPASGMPVSVNESILAGQCLALESGAEINTTAFIYAGVNDGEAKSWKERTRS